MIPTLRENDSFIMTAFINANIPSKKLEILNIMRLHLKAFTVSDIATSDGKNISYNSWNFININGLRDGMDWPRSPPIFTTQQKDIWREALKKTFCNENANTNEERKIIYRFQPGKWKNKSILDKWKMFYSRDNLTIYKKENNGWRPYSKASRSRHRYARENNILTEKPESANKLVSAYPHGQNRLIKESFSEWQVETNEFQNSINPDPIEGPFIDIEEAF